jgi:hypothetical protein
MPTNNQQPTIKKSLFVPEAIIKQVTPRIGWGLEGWAKKQRGHHFKCCPCLASCRWLSGGLPILALSGG